MIRQVYYVREGHAGILYEDGALVRVLAAGRHVFWNWTRAIHRDLTLVDLRERSATIKNQEILTADKVALRLSLLVYFKVTDATAALQNVESYEVRLYEDVQLAARRFLATRTLDQILRDRNDISDAVREDVGRSGAGYGVEIKRADVKDLVFPGNLREIMNKAIEAERQGEALLIAAGKHAEVVKLDAATRSETARVEAESAARTAETRLAAAEKEAALLAANPQLVRLRELEVLREIGARGGNHFYVGVDKLVGKVE
jgi:regulator of protease activity HflC (stomatin/prohibitin superfamily)